MSYFDTKFFKKKSKVNRVITRKLKNEFIEWELGKEYYDGDRNNGYGGFLYDGRWLDLLSKAEEKISKAINRRDKLEKSINSEFEDIYIDSCQKKN